jgi:phospholipid/cholesterol/gamma-HCH transport system substrate-binding protein
MASANKSWAQLRVGLTAIFALGMLGVLIFYMTSNKSLFRDEVKLVTYFESSGGIAPGQSVRLNGLLAGKVEKVELSGLPEREKTVRIIMRVARDLLKDIPSDSTAQVGSENLLSGRFLAITRGKSGEAIRENGEIRSFRSPDIDEMKAEGVKLLASANTILTEIEKIVRQVELGKGTIGKLLVDEELYGKFLGITNEVAKLSQQINSGKGAIGKLLYDEALYSDVRKTLARADQMLLELQEGKGTAGKLLKDPAIYDETRKSIAEVRRLMEDLNAGKGSAGKLLKSDELHNQLAVSLKKLDTTIDKLNSGQGTLGQLLVNPSLYENLNGATREMNGLMKDFRANPKKFLHIKLGLF